MAWGIQGGRRLPQVAHPELREAKSDMTLRSFKGWPPAGCRRVVHGGPLQYFRESMASPCPTPLIESQPTYTEDKVFRSSGPSTDLLQHRYYYLSNDL